jgi:hypothetical protein
METQILKLGKQAPKEDSRTLMLGDYLTSALPPAPAKAGWEDVKSWGMMLNDSIGDCTCAGAGHMIEAWRASSGSPVVIPDAEVLSAYEFVSGYDPKTGDNDNGAVCLDVLNAWRKGTIFSDHTISAYAKVEPSNHDQIKDAVWLFGGCYIGVALPICVQGKKSWTMPHNPHAASSQPGSWGGHCVDIVAYDSRGTWVVSWGELIRVSWPFLATYCDEAYAVLSHDWIGGKGQAPDGFDLAQLQADLAFVSKAA